MKAFLPLAMAVLLLSLLLSACAAPPLPRISQLEKLPVCDSKGTTQISRLSRDAFTRFSTNSCVRSINPVDVSAWLEAAEVSYRQRGLQTMVLGCANLTPDSANCQYSGLPGHAATLNTNFNFAIFPLAARVQKAVIAVFVENNASFFTQNAQVRGRLSIGDQYQSLGATRTRHTTGLDAGWILIDITDFAARAINEQRISASFEISLPCGRNESELTTVRVLKTEPIVVVEYK
ncbi:MAG: hypothetical protein LBF22_13515 [Deltaproteobacteria bacterium]|jgi:hypothetical protein|nr:hypothetical protein [Deltaproteobacteria bacterium]